MYLESLEARDCLVIVWWPQMASTIKSNIIQ